MKTLLKVYIVNINPKTNEISENKNENTLQQYLLIPYVFKEITNSSYFGLVNKNTTYELELDKTISCSENTFEEAIINIAKNVYNSYGTYTEKESIIANLIQMFKTKRLAKKYYKEIKTDNYLLNAFL